MGRLRKVQGESQAGTTGSWELGVEQQERIRLSRQTDKCDQQEEKRLQSLRLKGAARKWKWRLRASRALIKHLLGTGCLPDA